MSLYPLGISRRRDVSSLSAKLAAGSADVRWSVEGELACAFIDAPHDAVQPMHHAAALDAIHHQICVLPMQFGVELHDEGDIRSIIRGHDHELLDRLGRLDWTCQMMLRIAPPGAPREASHACSTRGSSSKPTEKRRSHLHEGDSGEQIRQIVQHFVEHLHGIYRDWRRLPSAPLQPIRLAFLLERDRVDAFQGRLKSPHTICRIERCEILGPWPPYSFVT
jgi:hypothetical protein